MASEIHLPWPVSFNTYYRTAGRKIVRGPGGKAWRREVETLVAAHCGGKPVPMIGRLALTANLWWPKHKRFTEQPWDLDNYTGKHLWDALTASGIWTDDSQVWEFHAYKRGLSGDRPGVEIVIEEI